MDDETLFLYGGKLDAFAGSMAEEMEKALNQVRTEQGMAALPTGDRDRRMLFIAIARGIINHLEKKQTAFTIEYGNTGAGTDQHNHEGYTKIKVKRPPEDPSEVP